MNFWRVVAALWLGLMLQGVCLAQSVPVQPASQALTSTGIERWLMRMHDAPKKRAYIGTFVVTAGTDMSSSRIWHVGDGVSQMDRVESLTGAVRTTFRHNDEVVTFSPEHRTVVHETRESLGLFPNLLNRADGAVTQHYRLRMIGQGRVAGFQADIAQLAPVDRLRYGYQIWTEQKTGLMIKLQTLDANAAVLEQAAFSELEIDVPVRMAKLKVMMDDTRGYQVIRPRLVTTTAEQEGWVLSTTVPGFAPVRCYKRLDGDQSLEDAYLQCVYSDGLASVSLFVEPFDVTRHARLLAHTQMSMGATSLRVRRFDKWLVTAVGEVPPATLAAFVQGLARQR